ncbi:replicative helicase loader/inhibitor [Neobacillus niacini]|uniref:replicative helicase loader/inhibitor n=1 Tax=Neobacillus niacini TaxID=86668 RepID=UPI0028548833|nr:replicative helicase loader/inhibitor [Neobacillus niacini]MDR7001361.1 hypothetical protein [Neobacillus niacini]
MIKRETFDLLKKIHVFYEQFVVDQEKLDLWHEVLKEYSLEKVQKNLFAFAQKSSVPPKVSDLTQKSALTIPDVEETRKIIYKRLKPANGK